MQTLCSLREAQGGTQAAVRDRHQTRHITIVTIAVYLSAIVFVHIFIH